MIACRMHTACFGQGAREQVVARVKVCTCRKRGGRRILRVECKHPSVARGPLTGCHSWRQVCACREGCGASWGRRIVRGEFCRKACFGQGTCEQVVARVEIRACRGGGTRGWRWRCGWGRVRPPSRRPTSLPRHLSAGGGRPAYLPTGPATRRSQSRPGPQAAPVPGPEPGADAGRRTRHAGSGFKRPTSLPTSVKPTTHPPTCPLAGRQVGRKVAQPSHQAVARDVDEREAPLLRQPRGERAWGREEESQVRRAGGRRIEDSHFMKALFGDLLPSGNPYQTT